MKSKAERELNRLEGVIAPILTPFDSNGAIVRSLWVEHAQWVLEEGAHYLSPFGTTGEALSISVDERKCALEWLVDAGIPPERLIPGTGLTALPETVSLTSHALALGCPGVMTLPPFFFTAATEDGLVRYFSDLIEQVQRWNPIICLYHIPQNTGVQVSAALTRRLVTLFPESIRAYKDSGGVWEHTMSIIAAAPTISVFPASESLLERGPTARTAGCISATVNVNARAIRKLHDDLLLGAPDETELEAVKTFRKVVQDAGLITAMKAMLAATSGEPRWLNVRAPLVSADLTQGVALRDELGDLAKHLFRQG
jgi:4-hydroxy-tetrahydrodipicolinate synthase